MNLNYIAELLGTSCSSTQTITGVCIDSRQVKPGNLFVALKGEQFDGHDFIEEAVNKGAIAVACNQFHPKITVPQFLVRSTTEALAQIAKVHRQGISCPIIALTGSNGKTTVKEMIASILPKPSHATPGNLNNHLGVPLSVLQLNSEHRYAVFELGANHLGEIACTAAIVQPQVALVNNIAPAHVGEFGSLDNVARAKGEIYQGLKAGGTAVINADDDYASFWNDILDGKDVLRFSLSKPSDVFARKIIFDRDGCAQFDLVLPTGHARVSLKTPGEHSIRNALAAVCCSYAVKIPLPDIVEGLNQFQGVPGRMTFLKGKNQSLVIDDTYNANLRSALTAVAVLAKRPGCRILVLGDMGELGEWTRQHHEEVGYAAKQEGIDLLLTCGVHSEYSSEAFGVNARHYKNQERLAQDLLRKLDKNTTVLVKGSRSASMEKIVHQLVG
jgi:UDP-N-acetylmuramoyl-tripeptide--D-alanyl-D-alanine ligase